MAKPANHQQHYNPNYQPQHPPLPSGKAWAHKLENGITLRGEFIESAAGSNAPVLHFVHGNGLACRSYESFLGYLHKRFALFLHNSQGHGKSDSGNAKEQPFVGWNGSAERVVTVIQAQQQAGGLLAGRRLIGSGHSFGGAVTLVAAAKYPHVFDSLVLFDAMMFPPLLAKLISATSFFGISKYSPLSRQARQRQDRWDNIEAAFQYFYQRGMLKTWHDDAVYSYLHHCLKSRGNGEQALCCPPWMESSIFASASHRLWPHLRRIKIPTQLFYGTHSYDFIQPAVELAVKRNPYFSAEAVNGNHFFISEDPACLANHAIWETLVANQPD